MTTPTKTMSGAELKVRLGALGLPPSWLAEHCNVTMRTVVRWFDGDVVPLHVADELDKLADATLNEMQRMATKAEKDIAKRGDGRTILTTYRTDEEYGSIAGWPASWHRQLTFRVLEHLEAQDYEVAVRYA